MFTQSMTTDTRTTWNCNCCGMQLGTDSHKRDECSKCRAEEKHADR